jgi:N-acetyl-anhydromuramyl-L-alanine amidase AmpD
MTGSIIINGAFVPVDAPVQTWNSSGLIFTLANVADREELPTWCVLHWTGGGKRAGLKGAKKVFDTLVQRGLSVDFVITDEGTIWQLADPYRTQTFHAGRLNKLSCGVEVTGPGWLRRIPLAYYSRKYKGTVHGWTTTFIDYTEAQHKSVAALATALSSVLPIAEHVTTEPYKRQSQAYFQRESGYCGHLHCASWSRKHPKCDPGPRPLERLSEYFEEREHG